MFMSDGCFIAILLGLQPGYTKYCCFCVNGTVLQDMKITLKRSGKKKHFESRYKKCEAPPLVETSKILLSLLHIKLGLIENYVKAMNQDGAAFK